MRLIRPLPPVRAIFILVHRYVGLCIAAFLIVLGITGSVIVFMDELDAWLNPELVVALSPADGSPPLDPFVLRERVQAQLPGKRIDSVALDHKLGRAVSYWIDGRDFFADPYSGRVQGDRAFGDLSEGKKNILPFIYELHASLALSDLGVWVVGLVGVLWTVDCFVGAYLTFPLPLQANGRRPTHSWLRRWLPSWLFKTKKLFSFVFTWHRASGLWLWGMFFVFAWSGVGLNLHDQIYQPVMKLIVDSPESVWAKIPELSRPRIEPQIDHHSAYAVGKRLMREQAANHGFAVLSERSVSYDPEHGVYSYWVESTLDVSERLAETHVIFDSDTGELRGFSARAGIHAGDTIFTWLIALHFGTLRVGGLAYRIFVCVMGLVVVLLSVTGVWIWWRKASKRRSVKSRPLAHPTR